MKNTSAEVDAYIERSAEFAQPILNRVRKLFHRACPEITETIKWGFPHFEYQGIVGSMAAFKQHVSFGFWKGKLLSDPLGLFAGVGETGMSALKVTSLAELPPDKILVEYIKEAVQLNENGVKLPNAGRKKAKKKSPQELAVPEYFLAALRRNKQALATFEGFSYSHRKEYVEWITGAKREETPEKRLAAAIEMLAEGKSRNWKYER